MKDQTTAFRNQLKNYQDRGFELQVSLKCGFKKLQAELERVVALSDSLVSDEDCAAIDFRQQQPFHGSFETYQDEYTKQTNWLR